MATRTNIVFACGGTAGHVYPALALAEAYRESHPGAELLFIGTPAGIECKLVPAHGYRLELIPGEPLAREPLSGKARAIGSLFAGTLAARRLLKKNNVELVIAFGGYATAGTVAAARSLGIKIALHEANVEPGLTNRFLARLADRIYLAFDATRRAFDGRAVVVGNPVRRDIVRAGHRRRQLPHRGDTSARFLITGGSGGSNFLNREAPAMLHSVARLGIAPDILHQAGDFPLAPIRTVYERLGIEATVTDYIKDIGSAYEWADFVVACGGSQTLSEIAVCDLPCLIVPLAEAAAGHQVANAIAFTEAGDRLWTSEENWETAWLAGKIVALLRKGGGSPHASGMLGGIDAAAKMIADLDIMMENDARRSDSPGRF
jgi:UDP-N-acetylglucosamine--N-acetylmuramyl-(pentapeptide) pyrophosphoryl-undecaprenol N-acetylglucosamine transferase